MKVLILLISLFGVAFSRAEEVGPQGCFSIDLRNSTLGAVQNQQKINWCYAFASADMLAYKHNIPEKISAADVAITYNNTRVGRYTYWLNLNLLNRNDPNGRNLPHQTGFIKKALKTYQERGYCPESVFPSEAWTKMTRTDSGWKSTQLPLYESMLEISKLFNISDKLTLENLPYYFKFKNVDAQNFLELLQLNNLTDFYFELSTQICQNDRLEFKEYYHPSMAFRSSTVFNRINEILNLRQLTSIDFDYRILEDRNHTGIKFSELHTVNIVGRRWNETSKSCQYLIRDSYGTQCTDYDPSYQCESGNIWVEQSILFKGMTSTVNL